MNWFLNAIYEFYENPKNQIEFQKWKKNKVSKVRSDCNECTIEFQKRCRKLGQTD